MPTVDDKFAAARRPRILHTFNIPPTLAWDGSNGGPGGKDKITMHELNTGEEKLASKAAGFDLQLAHSEAAKRALHAVDGRLLVYANGDVDTAWEDMGAPVRALCIKAYLRFASAREEDDAAFFESEVVTVE
jgi:hypothetical protein